MNEIRPLPGCLPDLVGRVPQHQGPLLVSVDLAGGNVPIPKAEFRTFQDKAQLLRALLQGQLGQLVFGNVMAIADIADEMTSAVVTGATLIENPAELAIGLAQAVFHRERLATLEVAGVDLHAPIKVIGVHAFGPAVPQFLFQATAGEAQPGLIEVVAELVRAGCPDQGGTAVGQGAIVLLAFP